MPVKSDKRTSNLFIAGGYCLVAIIILFNYLGQTETKDRLKEAAIPVAHTEVPASKPADNFSRQLEEERRLNLEMREIIQRLQGAVASTENTAAAVSPVRLSETGNDFLMPQLNKQLIEDAFSKHANPFIPGKNPFAVPNQMKDMAFHQKSGENFLSLKCDPRLPFVFTGANTKSEYFSNF